jgi:hypothetical protein
VEATDYALPPGLHPVLSIVPRSYQVELVRAALILLAAGALGPGTAIVQLGDRRCEVRLDAAQLYKALAPSGWSAPAVVWQAVDTVARAIPTPRRRGRLAGWRLRWWPEPLVAEQGALWPEFTLRRGATSIGLLPLPSARLAAEAVALGALAERLSFIILSPQRRRATSRPP